MISFFGEMLSGLEHHLHLRGHPLKNTKVRMPLPSYFEYLLMLNILTVVSVI